MYLPNILCLCCSLAQIYKIHKKKCLFIEIYIVKLIKYFLIKVHFALPILYIL